MFDFKQTVCDKHGELNVRRVSGYIDGLMDEFAQSPEAKPIVEKYGEIGWAAIMVDFAFNHLGQPPAEMSVSDFNEVVFTLFPRKVSVQPEEAASVVEELRAFWSFVAREYGARNAEKILATLGKTAVSDLEIALADPRNYGLAKSFFIAGANAGYDMASDEGLAAYLTVYNAQLQSQPMGPLTFDEPSDLDPLPLHLRPYPFGRDMQVTHDEIKKKRQDKKRQRQNKKRNR